MAFRPRRSDPRPGPAEGGGVSQLLYLSCQDVERIGLSGLEIEAEIRALFADKAAGRVEAAPKLGIHPGGDSFLHAMPAYVPRRRAAGVKWIGAFPGNRTRGLPQMPGLIVINDDETGLPRAVLDARWVTAARTAGASALAAGYLAPEDTSRVGILGCGVKGRAHLVALCKRFRVEEVVAYDLSEEAFTGYAEETQEETSVPIRPTLVPREAVEGCDVVVTAGPIARIPYATIRAGWVSEGAFAVSIDYASAWSADALAEFDWVYTDDIPQLESHRKEGYFPHLRRPDGELSDLVAGGEPGRAACEKRILACFLGLAAADVVVGRLVVERAIAKGIGTWLPL